MPAFGGGGMIADSRFDLQNVSMLGSGFRHLDECTIELFSERVVNGGLDHGTLSLRA